MILTDGYTDRRAFFAQLPAPKHRYEVGHNLRKQISMVHYSRTSMQVRSRLYALTTLSLYG